MSAPAGEVTPKRLAQGILRAEQVLADLERLVDGQLSGAIPFARHATTSAVYAFHAAYAALVADAVAFSDVVKGEREVVTTLRAESCGSRAERDALAVLVEHGAAAQETLAFLQDAERRGLALGARMQALEGRLPVGPAGGASQARKTSKK